MKAVVESRRFRTWETDVRGAGMGAWMLLLRSLFARYSRAWYVYMLIVLGMFGSMLGLYIMQLESGSQDLPLGPPTWVMQEGPIVFIIIAMVLFTLVVAAPSIAEDIRFNAQLFYFSKPMRVVDYLFGKTVFNVLGMVIVGIIPFAILSATILGIGPGDAAALEAAYIAQGMPADAAARQVELWKYDGVDNWSEAFYLALIPLVGVVSLSIGLVGFTMMLSAFTRRAWHAAVGVFLVLQGWSALGEIGTQHINTSHRLRYFPNGWMDAVLFLPSKLKFRSPECVPGSPVYEGDQGWGVEYCRMVNERLVGGAETVVLSHIILVTIGVLGVIMAWGRLKKLEGAA